MSKQYRADHVGSLLRPPHLLKAHAAHAQGRLPLEELRRIEDAAILDALAMEQSVGLPVLSDGEYRRPSWAADFTDAVEGYVPGEPPVQLRWRGQVGTPLTPPPVAQMSRVIGARLHQVRRLTAHESSFLREHAAGDFKITMPAPSYVVSRGYKPGVTDLVYGSRAEVLEDASAIINAEIKALIEEGVRYIQLDDPHYPDYVDAERQEQWRAMGVDPAQALREDIEADNAALQGLDRTNVTLAMHICRGNGGAAGWHTEGGYDSIAEQLFNGIDVDRFLLEYDSERAGGFEPLRYMPRNKTAVLGLITTKAGTLESADELTRRIDDAAEHLALDNLALSPQCGFASVMAGNPLSPEEQRRKLALVVEVARKTWGSV